MIHIPVLKKEILDTFQYLQKRGLFFVDCTLGMGGHSLALADMARQNSKLAYIGIDQDQEALDIAQKAIKGKDLAENFTLVHDNFKNIGLILEELKIKSVDGILVDLGVSSFQLDTPERGFSFKDLNQPLDMRMDRRNSLTAEHIVNSYPKAQIEEIIRKYGEEKFARKIAEKIVEKRQKTPIKTIGELILVLESAIPKAARYKSRVNFATKTFQALRIEVNKELEILNRAITEMVSKLTPSGRLAIITFHSLEDRIVKKTFQYLANPCQCPKELPVCVCGLKPQIKIITKKPILPAEVELNGNPRARSAKLRIAEKL